jgi:hypothetical protein
MGSQKQKFKGFFVPNSTQVPDALFDELLADLSGAETKTVLYIIRRTFGFKKHNDAISINQMLEGITKKNGEVLDRGTGLSRPTLIKALKGLADKNVIIPLRKYDEKGGFLPTEYSLNIINYQPAIKKEDTPSKKNLLGVVKKVNKPLVKKLNLQDTVIQDTVNNTVNVNAKNKNSNLQKLPDLPEQTNKAEYLAKDIVDQLGDQHSINFYRLTARKIPETIIRQFLSEIKSDGADNPARLFTYKINKYTDENATNKTNRSLKEQREKLAKKMKNRFNDDTS